MQSSTKAEKNETEPSHLRGHLLGKAHPGVKAGAHGGAAGGEHVQAGKASLAKITNACKVEISNSHLLD